VSIFKRGRGLAAGLIMSIAALGTVAAATPSQAADVRFGIVVSDHGHRPPLRYERIPVAPRIYARTDWRPGEWRWQRHHWEWVHGRFDRDWNHDHRGRW
jgi:hypothetical protein